MSADTVSELLQRANALTLAEQLLLATQLIERARELCAPPSPRHKWQELDGVAPGLLDGEDAQVWVSRGRREADEDREQHRG